MSILIKGSRSSILVVSLLAGACSSAGRQGNTLPNPRLIPAEGTPAPDVTDVYKRIGLLATPSPLAFVGKVSAFAGKSPDTTLVLASISIPNRALTFTREGDRY